jgi:NAD(P) transhydrogenase
LPRSLTVVGAGVIGCEYACIFAQAGLRVTLIDERKDLLGFLDREVAQVLARQMTHDGVRLLLGESVESVESEPPSGVTVHLRSGRVVFAQALLSAVGRRAATKDLDLERTGLTVDSHGRLRVNEHFQTAVSHIYAAGDVIGFPSLAATSAEQGRLAACHACEVAEPYIPQRFPYGLYTIPEVSFVGSTEEQLRSDGVEYVAGRAWYRELARGQILGDREGLLKLLVSPEDGRVLAVHAIGDGATELIHIGQAVLSFGGTVEYFIQSVFNYPTLAEAYKVAAFDVRNRHLFQHPIPIIPACAQESDTALPVLPEPGTDRVARDLFPEMAELPVRR